ncbi:MAG: hypothetical protein ACLUJG_17010 [Lawsonibacter sp.]
MNLELSRKQFRRLLDLVYIGNWILNSTRGDQRFTELRRGREPFIRQGRSGGDALPGGAVPRRDRPIPRLCGGRDP